jgi:cellulose synthase/poly-beta-1,6-N-acetylglucosamine synthase-like glycosyltransferase
VNTALSIALPTYNRGPLLDTALARLIATVAPYGIRILVSDNASTDDTAAIVKQHAAHYPLLDYVCNAENLGPDGNFEAVLRQTSTRYVWLLGDTYEIEAAAFSSPPQASIRSMRSSLTLSNAQRLFPNRFTPTAMRYSQNSAGT